MDSSIVMRRARVLDRFFEDRIAADQRGADPDNTDLTKRLPQMEPNRSRGDGDKDDTRDIGPVGVISLDFVFLRSGFARRGLVLDLLRHFK